ncbi:MAG TPA: aminotransferase class IV [Actinomycetota bacterium]|nr:aminotransferase class IV [Actinomycetota bacterium]
MLVWLNGALVDEREARISPFDHGLLVGDGAFETIRVYNGVPFAMTRHLERLETSAAALGIVIPARQTLREASGAVLRANGLAEARVRITVTAGRAPLGSARGPGPPTVVVAASTLDPVEPTIAVAIPPWPRSERSALAGVKSISYAENVVALAWAHERGAGEAIFANLAGNLCEGTGTNVFLVEDGRLLTPPLTAGCLAGVTRALVLEIAPRLGIDTTEQDRQAAALSGAQEAFLTGTTREVQPISSVDGHELGSAPGPLTERIAVAFGELVATDPDP